MGGATGEDAGKGETAQVAGEDAGKGETTQGAGENAGSGAATAPGAGENGGSGAATAQGVGEERGEAATVHGVMREGMAVLIDVNGEKASFAMLQRNRCASPLLSPLSPSPFSFATSASPLFLLPSLPLPPLPRLSPFPPSSPSPFLRSFLLLLRMRSWAIAVLPCAPHRPLSSLLLLPFIISSFPANCFPFPPSLMPEFPHSPLLPSPRPHPPSTVRVGKQQCSLAPLIPLTVRVGKQQCSLAPLIGCPFGSVFELRMGGDEGAEGGGGKGGGGEGEGGEGSQAKDAGGEGEDDKGDGGKGGRGKWGGRGGGRGGWGRGGGGGRGGRRPQLVRVSKEQLREAEMGAAEGSSDGVKDNRNLIDDNTAQKLSASEIEALKRQAASGHEVVRALAANSVSFHTKTDFAQEKYLRKKQKKHAPRLVARFPTADSVCEAYFAKAPARIGFLRPDSLAMLLAMANVGAHSQLLVLDGTGGLITAAAAQRMGGHGAICSAFYGSHVSHAPSIDIIRHLNISLPAAAMSVALPCGMAVMQQWLWGHGRLASLIVTEPARCPSACHAPSISCPNPLFSLPLFHPSPCLSPTPPQSHSGSACSLPLCRATAAAAAAAAVCSLRVASHHAAGERVDGEQVRGWRAGERVESRRLGPLLRHLTSTPSSFPHPLQPFAEAMQPSLKAPQMPLASRALAFPSLAPTLHPTCLPFSPLQPPAEEIWASFVRLLSLPSPCLHHTRLPFPTPTATSGGNAGSKEQHSGDS
ncbi:unnamed protein product [Closterium sp. Naga37s-1]|nr:unnamed protein product [Closterium sp. Naga37s-1]